MHTPTMPYYIMNGTGNRFFILDARGLPHFQMNSTSAQALASPTARYWQECPRKGADQIIIMRLPVDETTKVFMEVWNADGQEVAACGNAARCVAALNMRENKYNQTSLSTKSTPFMGAQKLTDNHIAIDMGAPKLEWHEVPLSEYMDTVVIDLKIGPITNPYLSCPGAVNMGNPHCVFFVNDINNIDVAGIGAMIEYHMLFPEQVNVGFAQILDTQRIRLRVWERGAGLTKSCGTGACATLVTAHRQNRIGRQAIIITDGGELEIEWRESDNHVIKKGAISYESTGVYKGL